MAPRAQSCLSLLTKFKLELLYTQPYFPGNICCQALKSDLNLSIIDLASGTLYPASFIRHRVSCILSGKVY